MALYSPQQSENFRIIQHVAVAADDGQQLRTCG